MNIIYEIHYCSTLEKHFLYKEGEMPGSTIDILNVAINFHGERFQQMTTLISYHHYNNFKCLYDTSNLLNIYDYRDIVNNCMDLQ